MAAYSVAHLDDIDEFDDDGSHYRPIRHHLGITAFGVTAWTAHAAGDPVINEHDEGDPTADQELFLVLRGHAVFEIDGDRVDAPAGTLVSAAPRTRRTATATADGTMILALEGTPGRGYDARGWELWAPLAPRYQAGAYAEVADRLAVLVAANPQYPMLFFNLACCESRCGRTAAALDHLRQAVEMSEEFRANAQDRRRPGSDPRRTRVPAADRDLRSYWRTSSPCRWARRRSARSPAAGRCRAPPVGSPGPAP